MKSIQKIIFLIAVAFPYAAIAQETEDPCSYEAVMDMLNSDQIYLHRALTNHGFGMKENLPHSPYSCAHAIKNAQVSDAERQELWALFLHRNCAVPWITFSLLGNARVKKLFTPATLIKAAPASLKSRSFLRKACGYLGWGIAGSAIGVSPIGVGIDRALNGHRAHPFLSGSAGMLIGITINACLNSNTLEEAAQQIPALDALTHHYFALIKGLSNILPENLVAEALALKAELDALKFYTAEDTDLAELVKKNSGAFFGLKATKLVYNERGSHMEVDWDAVKKGLASLQESIDEQKLSEYLTVFKKYYKNLGKQAGLA